MKQFIYKIYNFFNKFNPNIWILIPVIFSTLIHFVILYCYFIGDDFIHFYQAANTGFWEFIITPHGGHIYIFMASQRRITKGHPRK